jgi:hypothetical protein
MGPLKDVTKSVTPRGVEHSKRWRKAAKPAERDEGGSDNLRGLLDLLKL